MIENRIRGRVAIEFRQAPNGEVQFCIDVDDWVKHYLELSPDAMAVARVPQAVIAARILADMCHGGGVEKALEFAAESKEKADEVHKSIEEGKKPMAGAGGEEQESSVH